MVIPTFHTKKSMKKRELNIYVEVEATEWAQNLSRPFISTSFLQLLIVNAMNSSLGALGDGGDPYSSL